MRTKVVLTMIGLLMLLLLGWWVQWFFAHHEQKSRDIKADVSPLAKRNSLLAADYFLQRLGRVSESVSGRDYLLNPPAETGLLIVSKIGGAIPPERQTLLLDWVSQGGHLVISPNAERDDEKYDNSLFEYLGVEINRSKQDAEAAINQDGLDKLLPVVFAMPDFPGEVAVAFTDKYSLFDSAGHADWQVETDEGAHLLQFDIGRGKITVLSDLAVFTNDQIGDHDHALFLAQLASDLPHVWLLYSSDMPSLIQLLWRHATALMISLFTLFVLLVWSLTQRSGPLLESGQEVRRNLMEHLTAVGHYIWRTDKGAETFRRSQIALEQNWLRRHPVLMTMQQPERCHWIADHVDLTQHAVERALYGSYQGEHEFIQVTAIQQKLVAALFK